jgi:hypothetical protein
MYKSTHHIIEPRSFTAVCIMFRTLGSLITLRAIFRGGFQCLYPHSSDPAMLALEVFQLCRILLKILQILLLLALFGVVTFLPLC